MTRAGAECNVGEPGIGEVGEHFETVDTSNGVFQGRRIKDCSMSPSKAKNSFPSPQSKICHPSASPSPFTGGGGGGCVVPAQSSGRGPGDVEWVVKRRSDGTRYVMRRPTRSRVLKERARQLAEERCSSTTTDDDAASELKRGRYWNRDARRKHLEMAKDRKSRKEMMQQQQQQARESAKLSSRGHQRLQLDIVEMSRRQMMQRQDKLFDNFTTLQELLAHGNREPPPPPPPHPPHPSSSTVVEDDLHNHLLCQHRYQHINPLLSVTTV